MVYKDLREFLDVLENHGRLVRIKREVDKDWEISCVSRWIFQGFPEEDRFTALFENVKSFKNQVVVGVYASAQNYALGLGIRHDSPDIHNEIRERWIEGLRNPISPEIVKYGPCKENIIKRNGVSLLDIPVPTWGEEDAAPFITSGNVITKDPDTGIQNLGTYRIQVKNKNRTGISMPRGQHIWYHLRKYQERKEPMPVAIALGVSPPIGMAATAKVPFGIDEFTIAGGLQDAPVELIKAETIDLEVPAHAELIIEGMVNPEKEEPEGPFGEYTGYMCPVRTMPEINVHCITHRNNYIYQCYLSQMPPSESSILRGTSHDANLYKLLKYDIKMPGLVDLAFTESSGKWGHVVISIIPQYPGHAKQVLTTVCNLLDRSSPKIVTVVDEDIDVRDPFAIDWAYTFRVQPDRDIIILPRTIGLSLDPSTGPADIPYDKRAIGSKILIDATIKHLYPKIALPRRLHNVLEYWDEYGMPPLKTIPRRTKILLEKGNILEPYKRVLK